jgi:hypothetical protein
MTKSLFLRCRSSASGTLGVGTVVTAGVGVIVGTVESRPPFSFSGSGVAGAGVESEGTIGGFSLDGGVETGATCEFVTGAEASTFGVAVAPLPGCSAGARVSWGNGTARNTGGITPRRRNGICVPRTGVSYAAS